MKRYETYNHAKTHIRYHLIFSTKYRRDCLSGIESELREVFKEISDKGNFRVLDMGIDGDHVHFLVKSCPSMSIEQIVRRLKQVSTRRLWQRCEEYLRRYYWKKRVIWSGGYFCGTVGEVSEDKVMGYIRSQG